MSKLKHTPRELLSAAVGRSGSDRRELERSSAPASAPQPAVAVVPDPEVSDRPQRRSFPAEYKRRILDEIDAAGRGQVGAIMRREGLYSSQVSAWRQQRTQGADAGLEPRKRGRKAAVVDPLAERIEKLEREKRRLEERLRKAEIIIDVQKKVSLLLGATLPTPETDDAAS